MFLESENLQEDLFHHAASHLDRVLEESKELLELGNERERCF